MRKRISGWEVWLCVAAVLVIAGFFIWRAANGETGTAVVSVGGNRAYVIDLRTASDRVISLRDDWGVPVELEIAAHRIRYINVTCPDHICEKTGFISKPGQSAVCMPNLVIVTIE